MARKVNVKSVIEFLEREVASREQALENFRNDTTSVFERQRVEKLQKELEKNLAAKRSSNVYRKVYEITGSVRLKDDVGRLADEARAFEAKRNVKLRQLADDRAALAADLQYAAIPEDDSEIVEFENRKIDYIFDKLARDRAICAAFKPTLLRLIRAFENKRNPESYVPVMDLHFEALSRLQDLNFVEFDESSKRVRLTPFGDSDDDDESSKRVRLIPFGDSDDDVESASGDSGIDS